MKSLMDLLLEDKNVNKELKKILGGKYGNN